MKMAEPKKAFNRKTTADEVLAGLDLTGKTFLLTGCASGIGFETMRALTARGAHVVGTARSLPRAAEACGKVAGKTTPIACNQDDFADVARACEAIAALGLTFDAIIANAGIMGPPAADVRYGVESQFRVNHLSHMLLVTRLAHLLRDGTGRVVIVSSLAAQQFAPKQGIVFDNLDAAKGYRPYKFYGQSKLANLAFAKTMAERLRERGVTSNALHPGMIASTGLARFASPLMSIAAYLSRLVSVTIPQGAATQTYLAAHPDAAGVTGAFYADCQPARPNPHADDPAFRAKLWSISEEILAAHAPSAAA